MSALTRVLRELAEEGADIAAATRRWATERFGDAADTPANTRRVRQAIERAEPTAARPTARTLAVQRRRAPEAPSGMAAMSRRQPAERPLAVARPRRADPAPLAVRPAAVAPEQPLALPPPADPLPEWAAKPRGGQWWADRDINGRNLSPQFAARRTSPYSTDPRDRPLIDWWEKALPRYIQNDFMSPADPLRGLAEQGLLHNGMSAADWQRHTADVLSEDNIGREILFPNNESGGMPGAGDDFRAGALTAMPWLARQPVTDNLYGISAAALNGLEFPHVADELRNAMRPETSGIPMDLAVRPESLQRMSFPQAVERVGRINQWRAAQQAEASLAAQSNPAIHTYREYAENNPRGLRWVELRAPEGEAALPEGWMRDGEGFYNDNTGDTQRANPHLQDALRYEGDTMGHCVGGYCDDVMSGHSRIYSLRDSSGQPHVTVEASPRSDDDWWDNVPQDVRQSLEQQHGADTPEMSLAMAQWSEANPSTVQDIVQIKGKQNRAPNDEYLPFVQDFVRNGTWGNVGDLNNAGLVRLPDGRYITQQQAEEAVTRMNPMQQRMYDVNNIGNTGSYEWDAIAPYFEGYAAGGRVDPSRCFTRHPLAAR